MTPPLRFRVAAHNAHDQAAAVCEAAQRADVVLWSEAVRVKVPGWSFVGAGKGVMTGWKTGLLSNVDTEWRQAHGGRAGVTPARGTLVVKATFTDGSPLALVNAHRINGTGWPGNRRRSFHRWRRARWMEHHDQDKHLVAQLVQDGYTVIFGGDLNRTDPPPIHHRAVPLRASGITQLYLVRGVDGPALTPGRGGSVARLASGTSHRLQWADLTLGEAA